MADAAALNRFFGGALNLFPFPMVQCRESVDYAASFKTYIATSDETKSFIDRLILARREIIRCSADNIRYEDKLAAVENYLPLLFTLQESWTTRLMSSQLPPIKLDRDLIFEWRLYINGRPELFKSNEFAFEIIMAYHFKVSRSPLDWITLSSLLLHLKYVRLTNFLSFIQALCHYYIAQGLIATDPVTFLSEAGKQMLLACSVMDLLHANISSNKWLRKFHQTLPNPPETSPTVAAGLSAYFRGCAQAMATIKAIATSPFSLPTPDSSSAGAPAAGGPPKTSPTVKARLCLAVVNLYKTSYERLANSNTTLAKMNTWMNEKLLIQIAITRDIFSAMIRYFLSQIHYEKTEIGICLGYLNHAKVSQSS